jgi:putative membrane protein
MTLGMIGFWALVVWAIVVLARRDDHRDVVPPPKPEDIVAMRLARGEIDDETYRRTIEALRARPEEWAGAPGGQEIRVAGPD